MVRLTSAEFTVPVNIPLRAVISVFKTVRKVSIGFFSVPLMSPVPKAEVGNNEQTATDGLFEIAALVIKIIRIEFQHLCIQSIFVKFRVLRLQIVPPVVQVQIHIRPDLVFFGTFIILGSDALHRLGKLADMPRATVRRTEMVRIKKTALIRFDSAVLILDLYISAVRNFEKEVVV